MSDDLDLTPERIERRRLELGLTRAAMAERCGVDAATVWRWETGQTEPHGIGRVRLLVLMGLATQQEADRVLALLGAA